MLKITIETFIKDYKEKDDNWKWFFTAIVMGIVSIILFITLIINYINKEGKFLIDVKAINYVKSIENNFLDNFFKFITNFGDPLSIIIMTVIVVAFLFTKTMKKEAIFFLSNIVGVWLFNELLKHTFKRTRPIEKIIIAKGYSFPSGHSMACMAFSIMIIYLIFLYVKNLKLVYIISILALLFSIIIGVSRIYLRVHFFTDVLTGWFASVFWVSINIAAHRIYCYKNIM
ncbi:phosphatase PAP2 family protein [Clostridium rectalis]|uniref:phosphatase PAP2 family protein n=1 Tax=Clostridium rectalis TaxID=2040295 RepID=UPI000F62D2A6|nr:phosphatase PAP2 family protein [Clostridium rectalis]